MKITTTTVFKHNEIRISVHELLINAVTSIADIVYDCPEMTFKAHSEMLDAIARKDIRGIRQAFRDGWTPMLVPEAMDAIDQDNTTSTITIHDHTGKIGQINNVDIVY